MTRQSGWTANGSCTSLPVLAGRRHHFHLYCRLHSEHTAAQNRRSLDRPAVCCVLLRAYVCVERDWERGRGLRLMRRQRCARWRVEKLSEEKKERKKEGKKKKHGEINSRSAVPFLRSKQLSFRPHRHPMPVHLLPWASCNF